MCNQAYVPCTNLKCRGVAETLGLIPCKDKPNCETTYTPIPGPKQESKKKNRVLPYCPACSGLTKKERIRQNSRAAYLARKAGTPLGKGGYARTPDLTEIERQKQMRQTRKGLMRGEKKANTQGAQAHAAQENTHGGVFDSRAESSAMGEHRGDFGSAFRPDFNGSFSHTGPGGELVSGSGETIGDTCANQETPSSGITPHPHTFPPQPTLSTTPDSTTEDPSGVAEPQYDHELRAMADWSDELLRDTAFSDLFSHTGQLVSDSDETIGDTRANQENPSSDTIPPPTPHHAVPPDSTTEDPSGVAEPQYADELRQMAEWSDGLLRDLGSFSHTGQLVSGSDETIGGTHANQETSSSDTIRPLPTPHHAVPPDSTAEYPSGVAEPQYDHELRAMAEWTDEELRDTAFSDLFSHTGPSEELVSGQTFPPQPTLSDTPLPTRPENQMIPSPTPHHAVPPDSAAEDFSGVAESPHAQKLRKFVDWVDGILRDIDNL